MFIKYHHIERLGGDETEGIDLGQCYVFPKIDGTNASIWIEGTDDGWILKAGSRTRELTLDKDNAGFWAWVLSEEDKWTAFLLDHPHWHIYGEWLVPHTLKTYREDAWRKFYVFDVLDITLNSYVPYEIYRTAMDEVGIECIPPLCTMSDPTRMQLDWEVQKNTYLIADGMGAGEGVVVKNYDYKNKFGRQTWAKLVRNEFKERNAETFGVRNVDGKKLVEKEFAETYVTEAFVSKTRAKIEQLIWEEEGTCDALTSGEEAYQKADFLAQNRGKVIPRLLQTCYHDLVVEEIWSFLKKQKNPTINFKRLNSHIIHLIKQRAEDLF